MFSFQATGHSDHEAVLYFQDAQTGLRGFIGIHSTKLGPATGGTRYMVYHSDAEALQDALRLSKAMTYKCALAGVPYGGGKAVIIADPKRPKTREYLYAYGKKVSMLGGNYYTGEDVGIDQNDVKIMAEACPYINGRPELGGSPSPWAALGVFYAMQAALEATFGTPSVEGKTFAIKGLGHLGIELCRLLYEGGGIITATDINPERVALAKEKFPRITLSSPESIHTLAVDAYAPCALGSEFHENNIQDLRCKIICGGANNQLVTPGIGTELFHKNILYIPDYLANAGGLINVVAEWEPSGYNRSHVLEKVKNIQNTAALVIALSQSEKQPTNIVADALAQDIFMNRRQRSLHLSHATATPTS